MGCRNTCPGAAHLSQRQPYKVISSTTALPPGGVTMDVRELYYTLTHAKKNKYFKQKAIGIEDEIQKHC